MTFGSPILNGGVIFSQYEEVKRVLHDKDMTWVEQRLLDIKRHAIQQTEFYKDYKETDEFPVVNKMTLIENHDACLAKEGYQTPTHISSTSGSTGTPFSVTQDFKKRNRTIFMIGACYVLGLLTDRVADKLTDKKKRRIKNRYPIKASTSILVWEKVKQDTFAAFTLSRIRILRSTMVNSAIIGVTGMLVSFCVYCNGILGILSLVFFEIMALIAWQAHTSLLINYYRKTQNLERDMANEEEKI